MISDHIREDASARQQHRVTGDSLGMRNGMPKSLNALARLLRERRIQFLGLTGTGLDDFDGRLLASALGDAPPRDVGDDSDELEIQDLT